MAKYKMPQTQMNITLKKVVKRLKTLTPKERARLLVRAGAIPPQREAEVADRLSQSTG